MINWTDVHRFANEGNPAPDRRVEKTPAEWREVLTPEQYAITREKAPREHSVRRCAAFSSRASMRVFAAAQHCSTPLPNSSRDPVGRHLINL